MNHLIKYLAFGVAKKASLIALCFLIVYLFSCNPDSVKNPDYDVLLGEWQLFKVEMTNPLLGELFVENVTETVVGPNPSTLMILANDMIISPGSSVHYFNWVNQWKLDDINNGKLRLQNTEGSIDLDYTITVDGNLVKILSYTFQRNPGNCMSLLGGSGNIFTYHYKKTN